MKRDDGSVYAIGLVAAGALASAVVTARRRRDQGSLAFERKKLSTDAKDGALIASTAVGSWALMAFAVKGATGTAAIPVPGARLAAATIIFTALMYTLGRRFIANFMSKDTDGKVRLLRRNAVPLLAIPGVGIPLRIFLRDDKRAQGLAKNLEEFFRDNEDVTADEVVRSINVISKGVEETAQAKGIPLSPGGQVIAGVHQVQLVAGSRSTSSSLIWLQGVLAQLHALRILYHTSHWLASGPNSYSDHLLYERLYDGEPSIGDAIDLLAEKMVAMFGPQAVDPVQIYERVGPILSVAKGADKIQDLPPRYLQLERELLLSISRARAALESEEMLSLGMDDALASLSSEREQAVYLLTQRSRA
jgi:DNA-binding ferritin-like protein